MKRKQLFGLLPFLSIVAIIFFAVLMVFSCKKESKNPVKQPADEPETEIQTGTMTDIDGNVYRTVKIGNQWWMAENFKVTHYRNGDAIPNVTDGTTWVNLTTGAYCNYDNYTDYASIYGHLYNWYSINDNRNITPAGWHVPSDEEWQTLVDSIGGCSMKEVGDSHWWNPNRCATNESGFSALPGGGRFDDAYFCNFHMMAIFWSSTESDSNTAWRRSLYYENVGVDRFNSDKHYGFSVRCVQD